ncbi:MAG: exo-alpha-sialidase [Alistipes sp.]|nr:exo-alpha-sialidase [Alistipes sp.]
MIRKRIFALLLLGFAAMASREAVAQTAGADGESATRRELYIKPNTTCIPFRIPAIATASNGHLVTVCDYRFSREDIGVVPNGRIDLVYRTSRNHGKKWGKTYLLAEGQGEESPNFLNVAFGDPAIVADKESSQVMVLSCAGNVSYIKGTRHNHQAIARFYSGDYGNTWSTPEDISESIYEQFDNSPYGPVKSMFVASGRIVQSRYVKMGKYYRLYCAVLVQPAKGSWVNFVLYSDNFGGNWRVLGGVEVAAIPQQADEAKVEELPDGRVLISSRVWGGRQMNIFTYDDVAKGTGAWGTMAQSLASNRGVESKDNACNGEIMLLPACRVSDGKPVSLLVQSVPMGPKRTNVGIYYKALVDEADYATPAKVAADWEGYYQVTKLGSAYSTMSWQRNNRLAFLFEEETYSPWEGGGYTIVYDSYSLEQLTNGKYRYDKKQAKVLNF